MHSDPDELRLRFDTNRIDREDRDTPSSGCREDGHERRPVENPRVSLHFHEPISPNHTAQHYLGYADDIARRIETHRKGHGARLTQVAKERRIGFTVVRVWEGKGRDFERQLKNRKNTPKLCPICNCTHEAEVQFMQ